MAERFKWRRHSPGAFMAETAHLPFAQIGILVRLRDIAWTRARCSLPTDRAWLGRRLGITDPEEFAREVEPVLSDFWTEEGDELVCEVLRVEFADAEAHSERARQAAYKRHHGSNWNGRKPAARDPCDMWGVKPDDGEPDKPH